MSSTTPLLIALALFPATLFLACPKQAPPLGPTPGPVPPGPQTPTQTPSPTPTPNPVLPPTPVDSDTSGGATKDGAPPQLLAAVALDPPFDTHGDTLWIGHGPCMPVEACTLLLAEEPGGERVSIAKAATLLRRYPPSTPQDAANLAGFLLANPHAFSDFGCTDPPTSGDHYAVGKSARPVEPTTVRMEGASIVITQMEACWDTPDRLVRAEEWFDPEGGWKRVELETLAEDEFLPRFK